MSRGRKTDDPKPIYLSVRVNHETKTELDMKSEKTGKTVSEIIREAIEIILGNKI